MEFNIFNKKINLHRPISFSDDESAEIVMRLMCIKHINIPKLPKEYEYANFENLEDKEKILQLYNKCEFKFTQKKLNHALSICIPNGVHMVYSKESNEVVSIMMSRHLSSEVFQFGGRIDWLATDPKHKDRGLGLFVAVMATNHLISRDYKNIWVTTQRKRPAAIKIFEKVGFRVINSKEN